MTKTLLISLFVVLLLCGFIPACTTQWTYAPQTAGVRPPIHVCIQAPASNRDQMVLAIHAWDQAVGGWRHVVLSDTACEIQVEETTQTTVCQTPNALACTTGLGEGTVYMIKGRYEGDPMGVLLHEIGHALGAQHLDGTLMSPDYHRHYDCPDEETVLQVAAYQHVALTAMRWCYR